MPSKEPTPEAFPLLDRLAPVARGTGFHLDEYHVWCGSAIKADGQYHLFAARWPREAGFPEGYRQHSEIVRAVSNTPEGPYRLAAVVIGSRDSGCWDSGMAHNPAIYRVGDTFALFYIGADVGSGHRQIGVATAPTVAGPWQRSDTPLDLGVSCDANNPSMCRRPDGGVLLVWRTRDLRVCVSEAPSIHGPYTLVNDNVHPAGKLEDFFLFRHGGHYHLLCEDNVGAITGHERWGAHLTSADGRDWRTSPDPVYDHTIRWTDGAACHPARRERPWLLIEDGMATHFFTGLWDGDTAWNQPVPITPPIVMGSE